MYSSGLFHIQGWIDERFVMTIAYKHEDTMFSAKDGLDKELQCFELCFVFMDLEQCLFLCHDSKTSIHKYSL